MPQDADHCEDHAGKVAVCVADENFRGVPVVPPEGERDADEGEEEVYTEEMRVGCWMRICGEEVEAIV